MMIESKIIKLLQTKALEIINDKNVKCINVNFNPPADKNWWELIYIPNNIENEFWDSGKTYRGVFRIIFHGTRKIQGVYKPMEEVERVADKFEKGMVLYSEEDDVKVIVTEKPNLTNIIEEQTGLLIGLTIRYLCFKL